MKTNFFIRLFLLLFLIPGWLSGQNNSEGLFFLNPSNSWSKTAARFDNVNIKITPAGTYANIDIEMDVSAKTGYTQYNGNALEIEYKFSLPLESHIHAAWLWMEGIQVPAVLYEKDQAKFIYESLVNRKIDPLIIYKNSAETYEARIYPLTDTVARKFKMSLIIPMRSNGKKLELPLPLSMFRSGQNNFTPTLHITVDHHSAWGTPAIPYNASSVQTNADSTVVTLSATAANIMANQVLSFSNAAMNDFFITAQDTEQDGYYQLYLSPKDSTPGRNFIFAIDYVNDNQTSYQEILKSLQGLMEFELNDKDSFNIIFTNSGGVSLRYQDWVRADSGNIAESISVLLNINVQNNTQLNSETLFQAIQFNNSRSNKGQILLVTNGKSQFSNTASANAGIHYVMQLMNEVYPINIVQVATVLSYDMSILNQPYYNNDYFLNVLSAMSGGIYQKRIQRINEYGEIRLRSLGNIMTLAMDALMSKADFDQLTYTYPGVLTDNYRIHHPLYSNPRHAYMSTGRYYNGSGPITLRRHLKTSGIIYQYESTLQPEPDTTGLTRKIWGGNMLNELTGQNSSGAYNSHLVNESKNYHVLCMNTAFLALEPDTIAKMVQTAGPVAVTAHELREGLKISAIPNPFKDVQKIRVTLDETLQNKDWELTITDGLGRVLLTRNGKTTNQTELLISWNGAHLAKGIYFAEIRIAAKRSNIKIVRN